MTTELMRPRRNDDDGDFQEDNDDDDNDCEGDSVGGEGE